MVWAAQSAVSNNTTRVTMGNTMDTTRVTMGNTMDTSHVTMGNTMDTSRVTKGNSQQQVASTARVTLGGALTLTPCITNAL